MNRKPAKQNRCRPHQQRSRSPPDPPTTGTPSPSEVRTSGRGGWGVRFRAPQALNNSSKLDFHPKNPLEKPRFFQDSHSEIKFGNQVTAPKSSRNREPAKQHRCRPRQQRSRPTAHAPSTAQNSSDGRLPSPRIGRGGYPRSGWWGEGETTANGQSGRNQLADKLDFPPKKPT